MDSVDYGLWLEARIVLFCLSFKQERTIFLSFFGICSCPRIKSHKIPNPAQFHLPLIVMFFIVLVFQREEKLKVKLQII